MNQCNFIGNLGRDPEMRFTPQGKAITTFSLAVKVGFGETGYTIWIRCAAWEKRAELCNQFLKKGSKVRVTGQLEGDKATGAPRTWTDKEGGFHTSFEMRVEDVEFLTPRNENGGTTSEPVAAGEAVPADDMPF